MKIGGHLLVFFGINRWEDIKENNYKNINFKKQEP